MLKQQCHRIPNVACSPIGFISCSKYQGKTTMDVFELNEVFVERDYESQDIDGNVGYVKLRIGKPQLLEQAEYEAITWCCLRQIIGIGDEKVRRGYGADGLHSLWLSLQMAAAELEVLGKREHKTLTWLGANDLGLPKLSDINGETSRDE
jgi:hypothetical protein